VMVHPLVLWWSWDVQALFLLNLEHVIVNNRYRKSSLFARREPFGVSSFERIVIITLPLPTTESASAASDRAFVFSLP